jgi:polyisoprenoid-binding protein YceI
VKKTFVSAALAAVLALPSLAHAAGGAWKIDAMHSSVGFSVRHLVISQVRGQFTSFSGSVALDDADLARSSVEATIDAASIGTQVADRDAHLKSPDFLDVAKYPTIGFKSTKVAKAGDGALKVTGDLTLHGVTKPVVLDVTTTPAVKGMYGETRRGFTATTRISRKEFGLTWNKLVEAGPAVGDEIAITLDLEAAKDQPKEASAAGGGRARPRVIEGRGEHDPE